MENEPNSLSLHATREDVDSQNVQNKYGVVINQVYFGSNPATSTNLSAFFNIPHPMELASVSVSFTAASASGTLQIEKLTGTQSPTNGTDLLKSAFSLSGAINTVTTKTGRDMNDGRRFTAGDRVGLVSSGVLTGLQDLVITMYFMPIGLGSFIK